MPLVEKISQVEDLCLLEILKNPVTAIEFINNFDKQKGDEPFELTWYQKEWLCDFSPYISIRSGRAVGKTLYETSLIIWALIYNLFPDNYINLHCPARVHLEPVWTELIRKFRTNTFLKQFIAANSGINSSEYKMTLLSQATLLCRIAGQTGTGVSVIALHSPMVIFEESGYYPFQVFLEAQPTLNTFTQGFKMIVAGVPTGVREKNLCYHADQENSSYSKHRISALQNPRFSAKDIEHSIEQYGGEESDDFIRFVKGEHGKPVFALFDRSLMSVMDYPVYRLSLDGVTLGESINDYVTRISAFPGLSNKNHKCFMGIDLGYSPDPTAIWIFYLDEFGRIRFHGKIRMNKVSYPIQEKLIDLLDSKFEPSVIGIDRGAGGQGISMIQHLMDDKEYIHKNYAKRITSIEFNSNISLGFDSSGEELKSLTKPFAITMLQDYCNNHKLVFSSTDLEMVTELERMTYTRNPTGQIVYRTLTPKGGKKGEDHFTSALLCGTLAYYMANDFFLSRPEKKKLFNPIWIMN
jgi:hypothetical protein